MGLRDNYEIQHKINSVLLEKLFMESLYIFKWKYVEKKSTSELQFYNVLS